MPSRGARTVSGWVKIDYRMTENPKVAALNDSAFRAYVCAITYSARNLTDGFLPNAVAKTFANGSLDALCAAGLWEVAGDGYRIHDYLDYQRSKADILELRQARTAAGSKGGKASSRAKDKQVLKQKPSKPQAEQELALVQGSSSPRALAKDPLSSEVVEIYGHWRVVCRKTDARYETITAARRSKITGRRRDGFSVIDIKRAITNAANDPWEGRVKHLDIAKILRSREQVDYFLDLPAGKTQHTAPRENSAAYRSFS